MRKMDAAKVVIRELQAKAMALNALMREAADEEDDDSVQEALVLAQTHLTGWGASLEIAFSCIDRVDTIPNMDSVTVVARLNGSIAAEESTDAA